MTDEIVRELTQYGLERLRGMRGGKVSDMRDDVLDHAFDRLGFEDDEDELWAKVSAAMEASLRPRAEQEAADAIAAARPRNVNRAEPWRTVEDTALATAPFRFTPTNTVVAKPENMKALNHRSDGAIDAVIDVTWQNDTPLLIGEENSQGVIEPFKLNNVPAIPGASLRGMLRSVLEIAAFGRLFQTNRHFRAPLRDFDHKTYRKFIDDSLATPGLQAGWLTLTADGPVITPCDWGYLEIADLTSDVSGWKGASRSKKYSDLKQDWTSAKSFQASTRFKPKGEHNSRRLYEPNDSGKEGYYVVSDKVPGGGGSNKTYEYVFFDQGKDPISIAPMVWDVFETINCKPSKNKRVPDKAWADFQPAYTAGGKVPIFYIGDLENNGSDPEFRFGLTRLFRIPHNKSVGELILSASLEHRPGKVSGGVMTVSADIVEHLFGHVFEPDELAWGHIAPGKTPDYTPPSEVAQKGRISVGFAKLISQEKLWPENGAIATIMGSPKPSFAPFYLAGPEKDYSLGIEDGYPRVAGRKRYLPRHRQSDTNPNGPLKRALEGQVFPSAPNSVKSNLKFLAAGSMFEGRIKLKNVSPAELGAVVWALTYGGQSDCRHMLGRARPFGAGQCHAVKLGIHQRIWQSGSQSEGGGGQMVPMSLVSWTPDAGREPLSQILDDFERYIAKQAGFPSPEAWRASPEVSALLKCATPCGWDAKRMSYIDYNAEGRQAALFQKLRKKTGIGSSSLGPPNPDKTLLLP